MTSNIALFSVLFLAVIVAIAFWHKCNIGILAIGGAFILGTLSWHIIRNVRQRDSRWF